MDSAILEHWRMSKHDALEFHRLFNQVEACLWFIIAAGMALWLRMKGTWRWLLPSCFVVFGISDLIEVQTGAWWEPWWLFVMKAACVLSFLLAWREFRRQRSRNA